MQIYTDYGYTTSEAVRSIVENNLYGLDIDERAAQLAYFSVMMKARSYDRRFLTRKDEDGNPDIPQPHVYAIAESNDLNINDRLYFTNDDPKLIKEFGILSEELYDAKEYGSILNVSQMDFAALYARIDKIRNDIHFNRESVLNKILPMIQVAETLAQKYHVVVTNPPYMGASNMDANLVKFVRNNYPDSKGDMSTVCMEKTLQMCMLNGYMGMINIPVWMFLSSYEKMRINMFQNNTLVDMVHPGRGIFGSDFGTTTFVLKKGLVEGYQGSYLRLFDQQGEVKSPDERERAMLAGKGHYTAQQSNFSKIPGSPVAYWVSETEANSFVNEKVADYASVKEGLKTGDNDRFTRLWYEISIEKSNILSNDNMVKWIYHTKGGDYRKWYGNKTELLNYENDGEELRNFSSSSLSGSDNYFKDCLTYNRISSAKTSFRYAGKNAIPNMAGLAIYLDDDANKNYILGWLNTSIVCKLLSIINPTLNFPPGTVAKLPVKIDKNEKPKVDVLVEENIELSKSDWDSFETSWDFQRHPLI